MVIFHWLNNDTGSSFSHNQDIPGSLPSLKDLFVLFCTLIPKWTGKMAIFMDQGSPAAPSNLPEFLEATPMTLPHSLLPTVTWCLASLSLLSTCPMSPLAWKIMHTRHVPPGSVIQPSVVPCSLKIWWEPKTTTQPYSGNNLRWILYRNTLQVRRALSTYGDFLTLLQLSAFFFIVCLLHFPKFIQI